mmetsp:Transcript_11693/g.33655  ORF Transcript_11693/g.33655 Transcript_11693/m.33655 type:complete len:281 (+) Transcript_11693:449-1291(+)
MKPAFSKALETSFLVTIVSSTIKTFLFMEPWRQPSRPLFIQWYLSCRRIVKDASAYCVKIISCCSGSSSASIISVAVAFSSSSFISNCGNIVIRAFTPIALPLALSLYENESVLRMLPRLRRLPLDIVDMEPPLRRPLELKSLLLDLSAAMLSSRVAPPPSMFDHGLSFSLCVKPSSEPPQFISVSSMASESKSRETKRWGSSRYSPTIRCQGVVTGAFGFPSSSLMSIPTDPTYCTSIGVSSLISSATSLSRAAKRSPRSLRFTYPSLPLSSAPPLSES